MASRQFFANRLLVLAIGLVAVIANGQENRVKRSQALPGKEPPHPPAVGQSAPDFQLKNLKNELVSLKTLNAEHNVVLLVLRGWPGYQCPICSRQVGEFLARKDEFKKVGAEVIMIYPGPADLLAEHAKEFQGDRLFTGNYHYLIDPDYKFTNAWGLRWEAERETAYPSTFVIGKDGKIKFGMTSTTHGDRASAAKVLEELNKLQ
jgi:peroxiredoxin